MKTRVHPIRSLSLWMALLPAVLVLPFVGRAAGNDRSTLAIVAAGDEGMYGLAKDLTEPSNIRSAATAQQFFGIFTDLKSRGASVGRIYIIGHGEKGTPNIEFSKGKTETSLLPKDVELPVMREKLSEWEAQLPENEAQGFDQTRFRQKIQELRSEIAFLESISEAMAPEAEVLLINCGTVNTSAGEEFVKNLGEVLMGKNGGLIIASRTNVNMGGRWSWADSIKGLRRWLEGRKTVLVGSSFIQGDWAGYRIPPRPTALKLVVEVVDAEKDSLIGGSTVELKLCTPGQTGGVQPEILTPRTTPTGKAQFVIEEALLTNVCSVTASHPRYEARTSAVSQQLLRLSAEPRRFQVSLKRKKGGAESSQAGAEWEQIEKVPDPDKMTGKAIGGYNVVQTMNEDGAWVINERFPGTKLIVQASGAPQATLRPGDQFEITVDASCETENEYCCIEGGVYVDNLECEPEERVGGCGKSVSKSQTYKCGKPLAGADTLVVAPFAGGVGPLVTYKYKKKDSPRP